MIGQFIQKIKELYEHKTVPVQTETLVEYDQLIYFPSIGRAFWESELIFTGVVFTDGVHQFETPSKHMVYDDPDFYRVVDTLVLTSTAAAMAA